MKNNCTTARSDHRIYRFSLVIFHLSFFILPKLEAAETLVDLSKAVVVSPANLTRSEKEAVSMLIEEVQSRTGIQWQNAHSWPADSIPVIVVGSPAVSSIRRAEGYSIWVDNSRPAPAVFVVPHHSRGVLFGVGHLLRTMRMTRGSVKLPRDFNASTAPKYPIRGHQLGYRPKTNSYDGWNLPQWKQYIRDLAVFGANAVELIPPRSDDAADSPHFPIPQMDMMIGMSQILADHDLDVWHPPQNPR